MQAIIIGAGRGQRLMPTTADTPKCFAEVNGRRIQGAQSLRSGDTITLGTSDIVFELE